MPVLVEALTLEFYVPIYRLAVSILDDSAAAGYATLETFIRASLNVYRYQNGRYRGPSGARVWLFDVALQVCRQTRRSLAMRRFLKAALPLRAQPADFGESIPTGPVDAAIWLAVDALSEKLRLPLLLDCLHGWNAAEIASLLHSSENTVQAHLKLARRKVLKSLDRLGPAISSAEREAAREAREDVEAQIGPSLVRRWPAQSLSGPELETVRAEIIRQVSRQGVRRQSFVSLKESLLVSLVILFASALIWGGNRLAPEPQLTPFPIAGGSTPQPPTALPTAYTLTATPTAIGVIKAEYMIQSQDSLHSIATRFGLTVEQLIELNPNNFLLEQEQLRPGQFIQVMLQSTNQPDLIFTPAASVANNLEVPSMQSRPGYVKFFLAFSDALWHTLWADTISINYGPPGYVGPPLVDRIQAWISPPDKIREVSGKWPGRPETNQLTTGKWSFNFSPYRRLPSIWETGAAQSSSQITDLVFPGRAEWFRQAAIVQILEEAVVAGRPALVIDWIFIQPGQKTSLTGDYSSPDKLRLWMDARSGIILRLLAFKSEREETILAEKVMAAVQFDMDFPQETLFDPRSGMLKSFTQDHRGQPIVEEASLTTLEATKERLPVLPAGRQPLPQVPPPPGFDPTNSALTFQYLPGPLDGYSQPDTTLQVDLFAGDYFLGSLPFANPWSMLCDRSPDGQKIAYFGFNYGRGSYPVQAPRGLHWFSLADLDGAQPPLTDFEIFDLAFAPDSRRLAFFGFHRYTDQVGLFILDTATGLYEQLYRLRLGSSLVWSPDGEQLALIGSTRTWYDLAAMVIHVPTKELVYQTFLESGSDWDPTKRSADWPSPAWPAHRWGVEFPTQHYGLAGCTRHPMGN